MPRFLAFPALASAGFLLTTSHWAFAQNANWSDLRIPGDGQVTELTSAGGSLWAGTAGGKVFRGNTGKDDWSLSLQRSDAPVSGIVIAGSSLYAGFGYRVDIGLWDCWSYTCISPGTLGGLYRSEDHGATWTALTLKAVTALDVFQDTLYAATLSGLFVSRDGNTWSPLHLGSAWSPSTFAITAVRRCRSDIILMKHGLAQRFRIAGDSLVPIGASLASPRNLAVIGGDALVNTDSALFHWGLGLTRWDTLAAPRFSWVGEDSEKFVALPRNHIASFYSGSPNGATWTASPLAEWDSIPGLCRHRGQLMAIGVNDPILRLQAEASGPEAWVSASLGINDYPAKAVAAQGGTTWVGKGISAPPSVRADTGHAWLRDTSGNVGSRFDLLAATDTRIFASAYNSGFVRMGQNWQLLVTMPSEIVGMAASGEWAAAFDERTGTLATCETSQATLTCSVYQPPIPLQDPGYAVPPTIYGTYVAPHGERLAADGDLLIFARDSMYVSLDRGRAWQSRGAIPGLKPYVIKARAGKIYAAGSDTSRLPVVAFSADTGRTWSRVGGNLPGPAVPWTLALRPGEAFAATDSGVFRAREGGSWGRAGQGMPEGKVRSLAMDGNRLVAGLEAGSVWELQLEAVAVRPVLSSRRRASALAPAGIFREGTGIWRRADGRALPYGKTAPR